MEFQVAPHPHSRLMMIITAIVVLLALLAVGYYWLKIRGGQTGSTTLEKEASQTTAAEATAQAATPQPASKIAISKDASPKTVAKEINNLNVSELKNAVKDLQSALALLKQ